MTSTLKPHIGRRSTPYSEQIAASRVSAYCKALGIQSFRAQPTLLVPPTFMTVFRKGEFELFQSLQIELSRILHTEQEYEFERPIQVGETLSFQTTLSHVLEKQTATQLIQFATFETTFTTQPEHAVKHPTNPTIMGHTKTMIVIRNPVS